MNPMPRIAVLYHIFYEDTYAKVCEELRPLRTYNPAFLFNVCADTPGKRTIIGSLQQEFPGSFAIFTSNKGKDIGAKLALLELLLQLNATPDYLLFLHDKKSLQALKSSTWKKDLLRIVEPGNIDSILRTLGEAESCGILATSEYIIGEPRTDGSFSGSNGKILAGLVDAYGLQPPSFEFVAGTMFWAKAKPVTDFFQKHDPLAIRKTLENENVLDNFSGTQTHSWERVLSWIVTSQGYSIKGI